MIIKKLLFIFLFVPSVVLAQLNDAQMALLGADINTNPDVADMAAAEDVIGMVAYYNMFTADIGWISNFSLSELFEAMDWQELISRTAAERDTLQFMFTLGQVNAGQANVRQGMADIFSGGQPATSAQRAALITASRRNITRAEKILSNGLSGGAYQLIFEGDVSIKDVVLAMRL